MQIDQHVLGSFLAVDLFYVLSGFVIAHAYEARLRSGGSTGRFMLLRLIRLGPLYLLGICLGLIEALWVQPQFGTSEPTTRVAVGFLLALLMLPQLTYPPLSTPRWSLFFELIANVVHAIFLRWLSPAVLLGVAVVSASFLLRALAHGARIDAGWLPADLDIGFLRVGCSYTAGVLLYRMRFVGISRSIVILWAIAVALLLGFAVLLLPHVLAVEYACLIAVFPVVVYVAVGVDVEGPLAKVCAFLGVASYAIYIIHQPVSLLVEDALQCIDIDPNGHRLWGVAFLVFMLALTWILDRYCDAPIRRWLAAKVRFAVSARPA